MKSDKSSPQNEQFNNTGTATVVKETDCSSWDCDTSARWSFGRFESVAIKSEPVVADFIEAPPIHSASGIMNDAELAMKRARISQMLDQLSELRSSGQRDGLIQVLHDSRAEVERLQREVLDYLSRPAGNAG